MERTRKNPVDKAGSRLQFTERGFFRKTMPNAKGVDGARWRPDVGPTLNKKLAAGAKKIPTIAQDPSSLSPIDDAELHPPMKQSHPPRRFQTRRIPSGLCRTKASIPS
ncbi:hypothetical protein IMZ48_45440 [Candidatus Bathyarchaeota archaeon]|nr:hypothetical protein [Candidatus Bathyarchaeota archaeon]